jgi:hypothetical protein
MRAGGGVWHGGTLPAGRIRGFLMIGENGIREVASSMSLIPWRPLADSLPGGAKGERSLPPADP